MGGHVDNEDLQRAARRIRSRREQLRVTQVELARRVGIGVAYLRRIELCRADPNVGVLIGVVEELGMTMGETFADDEREPATA